MMICDVILVKKIFVKYLRRLVQSNITIMKYLRGKQEKRFS